MKLLRRLLVMFSKYHPYSDFHNVASGYVGWYEVFGMTVGYRTVDDKIDTGWR